MNIGVTGATGFIGSRLVEQLLKTGHSVRKFVRSEIDVQASAPRLTVIRGDVENCEALRDFARVTDCVIHLAAFVHQETASEEERQKCYAVNVTGTQNLLEAIKESGRTQHLIFLSSVAVYGSTFTEATEREAFRPATGYAQSKVEAERLILQGVADGTITACILRPSMVFGPDAPGNLTRLLRLMRLGIMPVIAKGKNLKSLVHVDDLIAIILQVMNDPRRFNGSIYNVAAHPPLSLLQIGEALAKGLGRFPVIVPLQTWMVRSSASVLRNVSQLSRRKIPDPSRTIETFISSATVNTSALQKDLGHAFRCTEKALEEIASHYKKTVS